jgi:hypothetical protein
VQASLSGTLPAGISPELTGGCMVERMAKVALRLYRAAEIDRGYFGQGSYWTPNLRCVHEFRHWADGGYLGMAFLPFKRAPLGIYSITEEPDKDHVLDFREDRSPRFIPSEKIDKLVRVLASDWRWVIFHEGNFTGNLFTSAVYLGDTPLVPALHEEARR